MNPFLEFVKDIEKGLNRARRFSVSDVKQTLESESKILLFSPHPDDECITGLLPLRLMRETGRQVINIPVTFGSNVERQAGRAKELQNACAYLGWHVYRADEGLGAMDVDAVVQVLSRFQPEIVFVPHSEDWNSRHISTHFLVIDAMKKMGRDFSCLVVETEFWGAMQDANLMVEGDTHCVADLVAATSLHTGEVARNPYHLNLPAWMQDNVRRGGEIIGGQGQTAPAFSFATLYRLRKWSDGGLSDALNDGKMLSMKDQLNDVFPLQNNSNPHTSDTRD